MDIVVDSCVVLAAVLVEEAQHDVAKSFFATVTDRNDKAWTAATLLWDVAARMVHPKRTLESEKGLRLPLETIPITGELFRDTQGTHLRFDGSSLGVVRSKVRGPDHVFLSCALHKRAPLVTWDGTLRDEGHKFGVTVVSPEEYIAGPIVNATSPVPTDDEITRRIQERVNATYREESP